MRRLVLLLLFVTASAASLAGQRRIKLPVGLSELEAAAVRDSNDAAAHYNVALAYWNAKRFDEAEAAFRLALQLDPRFAPAHLGLAYLPYARRSRLWIEEFRGTVPDEWKGALETSDREYRHAFLIDPMVDIRIMAAALPASPDFLDVKNYLSEVWALYFQGFNDCQEGRYADCRGRFNTLIREIDGDRYPRRIPNSVLWYQGLAAAQLREFPLATSNFRLLLEREDERESAEEELVRVPLRTNEYRYFLATLHHAAGTIDSALPLYRQALENDIGLYMAHVRMANIYEAQRRYPEAIEARRGAVNANPDDATLLTDLGVTLGKAGQFKEAAEILQQASEALPREPNTRFWLGLAHAQLGDKAAARASFEQFIALAPSRLERRVEAARQQLAGLQ